MLLSYDGSEAIARISPVWGFITIVTPCLSPTASIPQRSAFVATRCTSESIVSWRFFPATGCRTVSSTSPGRPPAVRSTSWLPYVPRSSFSNVRSTPARPIESSGR